MCVSSHKVEVLDGLCVNSEVECPAITLARVCKHISVGLAVFIVLRVDVAVVACASQSFP